MTQTTTSSGRRVARFLFMAFGGVVLVAVASAFKADHEDDVDEPVEGEWDPGAPERQPVHIPRPPRRFWATLTIVCMFFAGASLAALGGDQAAQLLQGDNSVEAAQSADATADGDQTAAQTDATAAATSDATAAAATKSQEGVPDVAPANANAAPAAASPKSQEGVPDVAPANANAAPAAGSPKSQSSAPNVTPHAAAAPNTNTARVVHAQHSQHVVAPPRTAVERVRTQLRTPKPAPDPEVNQPGVAATIWLNRALPDPTPPQARLTMQFAANLAKASRATGADWALVLGVLRAEGANGRAPADRATLLRLGRRLVALERAGRSPWDAAAAFIGTTNGADRALALASYNRAVGLWALVHGLEAAKKQLVNKVLSDTRVSVYSGGRSDLEAGKVDVRVVAVIAYLAESFGQVTVSCLVSGHRLYARPGVISAHIYGRAVDIAALGGESIEGNQQPGGVTEKAVRDLLLLPGGLLPKQIISLLGLGGPSFALADHYNHIHVGY